jgi:hypothetical protein
MTVSNRSLIMLADACWPTHCGDVARRWEPSGDDCRSADKPLLVLAHLRKGETYADLAHGFAIGTTTVYRYLREGTCARASTSSPPWRPPSTRRSPLRPARGS